MTLYEINEQIQKAIELGFDPETGEILDETALEQLQMDRDEKIENICLYIKDLYAEADAIYNERRALEEREKASEKRATAKQMLNHPWLNLEERENYIMSEWEIEKMNLIEENQKEKMSEDEDNDNNNYIINSEDESIQADEEDNDIYEENEELFSEENEGKTGDNLDVSMDSFADYNQ